ncbi:MAG TPA: adenosylcobinamide-phosphate synthase CbiB [Candidatus Bathyarchaeia archaeon]|nr:adenosylcobinamide-phosphate synthase CbiB [Candidatus Bathyarchaeia archaeon]
MEVLLLAVALDLTVGDPPNRAHPVAWMGRLIDLGRQLGERCPPPLLRLSGGALAVIVALAAGAGGFAADRALGWLPWPLDAFGRAWLLKCTFSLRGLVAAVWQVRDALAAGDLAGARAALGTHLVSRHVRTLDASAVASAAIESLSENLTDSWVAPLCFYLAGGLPAAWAYRAINTADAMIGYREGLLERLGAASARLDDVLNFLPARLAACALVAGAWLAGESAAGAWRAWHRDARLTASPNAGRTMATMAGALGVALEKRAHYRLGSGAPPDAAAIDRAVRVAAAAAGVTLAAALAVLHLLRRAS